MMWICTERSEWGSSRGNAFTECNISSIIATWGSRTRRGIRCLWWWTRCEWWWSRCVWRGARCVWRGIRCGWWGTRCEWWWSRCVWWGASCDDEPSVYDDDQVRMTRNQVWMMIYHVCMTMNKVCMTRNQVLWWETRFVSSAVCSFATWHVVKSLVSVRYISFCQLLHMLSP